MSYPKVFRLGAILVSIVAAIIFAAPVVVSVATPATAQATNSSAHAYNPTMIPQGKSHFGFTGYSFPDTSAGRSACENKGTQLVSEGWGYGPSCVYGNPDKGRWNLWMWLYT